MKKSKSIKINGNEELQPSLRTQISFRDAKKLELANCKRGTIYEIFRTYNAQRKYLPYSIEIVNKKTAKIRIEEKDTVGIQNYQSLLSIACNCEIRWKYPQNVKDFILSDGNSSSSPHCSVVVSCQTLGEIIKIGEAIDRLMLKLIIWQFCDNYVDSMNEGKGALV